jgi:hypothetical protein
MPDAQLICPKAKEHGARPSRSQLQVSTTGLGLRCQVCGHRGRVTEFYVKSVGINVPTAGAVAGGEIPGGPG